MKRRFSLLLPILVLYVTNYGGLINAQQDQGVGEIIQLTPIIGFIISSDENRQYNFFPSNEGFVSAEIVKIGNQYQLHITTIVDGKRLRQIQALTAETLDQLRRKATENTANQSKQINIDRTAGEKREGRLVLNLNSLGYGLWLYGIGLSNALELEDGVDFGTVLLVGGGAYVGSLFATRNFDLGYGRSKSLRWSAYVGTLYGLLSLSFFDSDRTQFAFIPSMVLTPIGGYTGYKLTAHRWFNKGETDLLAAGSLAGIFYGWAIPYLVTNQDFFSDEEYIDQDRLKSCQEEKVSIDYSSSPEEFQLQQQERNCMEEAKRDRGTVNKLYSFSMMMSIPASVYLTSRLIPSRDISQGRAQLLSTGGIVGILYGFGLTTIVLGDEIDDMGRIYTLSAAAGLPIGYYLAERLTRQESYSRLRSVLIAVGGIAGAFIGAAPLAMAEVDNPRFFSATLITTSAIGLWLGHKTTGQSISDGGRLFQSDRFSVQLASMDQIVTFGLAAWQKAIKLDSRNQQLNLVKINLVRGQF